MDASLEKLASQNRLRKCIPKRFNKDSGSVLESRHHVRRVQTRENELHLFSSTQRIVFVESGMTRLRRLQKLALSRGGLLHPKTAHKLCWAPSLLRSQILLLGLADAQAAVGYTPEQVAHSSIPGRGSKGRARAQVFPYRKSPPTGSVETPKAKTRTVRNSSAARTR